MEEREEEELIQPVFSTSYYTDDHLAEAPRREKMGIENDGKPRHRHRGGRRKSGSRPEGQPQAVQQPPKKQPPRPPKQRQDRAEGGADRPAGENKRRRPPYRNGGRRWNKGGDAPKT